MVRLRPRHGAGDEHWDLTWDARIIDGLGTMDSDDRFRLLWVLMDANRDGERRGYAKAATEYREAFADGRLRKRKVRGQAAVKVWVEHKGGA